MKKRIALTALLCSLLLASCSNGTSVVKNPYEEMGLEGNAAQDQVAVTSSDSLKNLLQKASTLTKYSYEITSNVVGSEGHFINYFTPHAWYEENDDPSKSFGYAETLNDRYLFKYYLSEDEKEVYPSVYEYSGYSTMEKVQGLYTSFTLVHIALLQSCMETFQATQLSTNHFIITDNETATVFRFMTTFGSSIADYLVAVYVDIIDEVSYQFKVTCDLGNYGNIICQFKPLYSSKIDFVNDMVLSGELRGVDYYPDVQDLLSEKMASDNFVLKGIKQDQEIGHPYTIHCTKKYFFLEYAEGLSYTDFGYVLVPKNTEITYQNTDENGNTSMVTQTLTYDACYGFSRKKDGSFIYDSFLGPVEANGIHYEEVEQLPDVGNTNTLYICPNPDGEGKVVYEWMVVSTDKDENDVYGFARYSTWPDSVGSFYFNGASATFYLSGTPLTQLGGYYFEKDHGQENAYYTEDNSVLTALANGLFGWGFQPTTTWMSYVQQAKLKIHKDEQGVIVGADIGLSVLASTDGGQRKAHDIYYTVEDFGQGNVPEVEAFLAGKEKTL